MKALKWFAKICGWFLFFAVLGFFIFGPGIAERQLNKVAAHDPARVSQPARALHAALSIGDMHADSLLWNRDLLKRSDYGHVDFPRLREGNVAVQVFTAVTKSPAGQNYRANSGEAADQITWLAFGQLWPFKTWDSLYERAIYQAFRMETYAEDAPDEVVLIRRKADLASVLERRAGGSEVVGAVLGIEGAHPLEGELSRLDGLYDAGYRLVGLTHFFDNEVGGSLHGLSGGGLTPFGEEVVDALEARSMIIDLAHASPQVARDVLARVARPVVVSHTGIHSHCQTRRNFEDPLMREIAAKGGLIGIGYWADVTCDDSFAGVARTIGAAVDLLGVEHVALGSDFDGAVTTGFDASELAGLTQALLDEGLSETQIAAVMGGNMMRLLAETLPD